MNHVPPVLDNVTAMSGGIAATDAVSGTSRAWQAPFWWAVRLLVLAAVAAFLGRQIWTTATSPGARAMLLQIDRLRLFGIALLGVAPLMLTAFLWHYLLKMNGARLPFRQALQVFIYSHVGRYLPGQIWAILGKVVLSNRAGIPASISARCVALEAVLGVLGAVCVSMLMTKSLPLPETVGWPLMICFAVGLFTVLHPRVFGLLLNLGLRLFRRPPLVIAFSFSQILFALAIVLAAWLVSGVTFYWLVLAIDPGVVFPVGAAAGALASAWLVGYLTLLAPAGIGVREAVLVALLVTWIPVETATLAAVGSRVLSVFAEFFSLAIVLGLKQCKIL